MQVRKPTLPRGSNVASAASTYADAATLRLYRGRPAASLRSK